MARFAPGNELGMQPLQPPKAIPAYHKDGPLQAPIDEQLRGATEQYLDFFGENEYSPAAFGRVAQLGTKVLKAGGGWKEANRALRKVSMERRGDHFEELHGDFFEGLVHPELLAKARENALHGIQARSSCDKGARVRSTPHPSLKEYLEEAASQL